MTCAHWHSSMFVAPGVALKRQTMVPSGWTISEATGLAGQAEWHFLVGTWAVRNMVSGELQKKQWNQHGWGKLRVWKLAAKWKYSIKWASVRIRRSLKETSPLIEVISLWAYSRTWCQRRRWILQKWDAVAWTEDGYFELDIWTGSKVLWEIGVDLTTCTGPRVLLGFMRSSSAPSKISKFDISAKIIITQLEGW